MPKLHILINKFGGNQELVPKDGRLYGHPFITEIGGTLGDLVSPIVFKIVVDAFVRAVILEV